MKTKIWYRKYVKMGENFLALIVLVGLFWFLFNSMWGFLEADWRLVRTFYDFISVILLVLVGLELIRLMVFHNFSTVLELMILIIARKMVSPEIDAVSILLSVLALAIVVGLNYVYTIKPIKSLEDLSS